MPLWTDAITPAELTGYARASLEDMETKKPSLARWLPNDMTDDIYLKLAVGQNGLVPEARFRAYDAEPERLKGAGTKSVMVELPAISSEIPISEYAQLRMRGASLPDIRNAAERNIVNQVRGVADRVERLRGSVLATGRAIVDQDNFQIADDFGRSPALTITAATLFSAAGADPISAIQTWVDLYADTNGVPPGAILTSRAVFRAIQGNARLATQLTNGASRPATATDVNNLVEGAGLPPIEIYDRRTSAGPVLPSNLLLLLPEPGATTGQAELGGTFWGRTLTSQDPAYKLQTSEAPGLVAGVWRNDKPPMILETIVDAIVEPVLANANLAMAVTVL